MLCIYPYFFEDSPVGCGSQPRGDRRRSRDLDVLFVERINRVRCALEAQPVPPWHRRADNPQAQAARGLPFRDLLLDDSRVEVTRSGGAYANALLQSEQGADTNAMRAMKDMLKDKSASHWMRLRAADYALSVGDSARAETIAREVLKENPKSVPALMRLADVALKKRDTKRSQELLERAIIIQPNNMSALETLARISYEIDRNMEATRDYSARILLVNDRNPNALLLNAEANALLRDMDKAADSYARLIKERPSLLDRMIDMAGRLASAGRNDDARLFPWGDESPTAERANFNNNIAIRVTTDDGLTIGDLKSTRSRRLIMRRHERHWQSTRQITEML